MIAPVVFILMCLLGVGFLGVRFATWLKIPHSVFLVLLGIVSGFVARHSIPSALEILSDYFPQVILYVLLPPLIFESAFHLDYKLLKKDLVPISALAVAALGASTLFVGYGLHFAFGLELLPCLTFGALISATDPIAVVALFREVGAPQRLSTLIEGESLLNDGTAMVLFRILLGITAISISGTAQGPALVHPGLLQSAWHPLAEFIWLLSGSVGVGLGIALFTSFLLRFATLSGAAQLGITVVSAYLSFLVSDAFLHLSGVISTLVVGLYLGEKIRRELNREAIGGIYQIWEFLALCANTLVFLAVGLTFDPAWITGNLNFIPVTLLIVYLARAASIVVTIPTTNQLGISRPISFSFQTVLMWGGLRGGLALGLVLTLPKDFPHRDLFIALAVSVVLATLTVNALTTGKILKLLRLDQLDERDERFFKHIFQSVMSDAYASLEKSVQEGGLSTTMIHQHRERSLMPLLTLGTRSSQSIQTARASQATRNTPEIETLKDLEENIELRFELLSHFSIENQIYETRFQEGTLSKSAYLELRDSLLSRRFVFDQTGIDGLRSYELKLDQKLQGAEKVFFFFQSRSADRLLKRLVVHLEVLLHLKSALECSKIDIKYPKTTKDITDIYDRWIENVRNHLQTFYHTYSHYYKSVQAIVVSQTHYTISRRTIDQLHDAEIINHPVYSKLKQKIEAIYKTTRTQAAHFLRPSASYLLGRIPLFQSFSRVTIRKLAESSPVRIIDAGRTLVKEGEQKAVMFVIVAGLLKVANTNRTQRKGEERLFFPGDYFGTKSLIRGEPQSVTLVAEVTTEILEVTRANLDYIFFEYPILKSKILEQTELFDSIDTQIFKTQ